MSKRESWNKRYGATDLVWGAEPNRFVEEALRDVEPRGWALDVACGEGRNAIWLAERGWRTTAVDFSCVAIERGRKLAARRGLEVEFIEADLTSWVPEPGAYALALVLYLHIPPEQRRQMWAQLAMGLAPGGEFFLVGHALRNLNEGVGGPQDPSVLWEPGEIRAELQAVGIRVLSAEHVRRSVEGSETDALDLRISARRLANPHFSPGWCTQ